MYYRARQNTITIFIFISQEKQHALACICKENKYIWFYLFVGQLYQG